MAALRIALADLSHMNEVNRHNLYVPLNVGFVAAYVKKRFGAEVEVSLYKDPVKLLSMAAQNPPDILGLGAYYWKNELNKYVARKIKAISRETAIVVGGPCIDSDHAMQERYLLMHPHYDWIIPNEGEVAFGNLVERFLGVFGFRAMKFDPLDGMVCRTSEGQIIRGAFINLSTDLSQIPSPYLDGTLDEWLDGQWQPLLQTSRLCPYTCAFCVSGKDRGKLRAFPLEQVREEIDYVARRFRGDRGAITYICDENFGIMERDLAVADYINDSRHRHGYPNRVFFYNDKRFTGTSRSLHAKLGALCYHGVCLSLQSENPEALKAINRRNLTDEQVVSAIAWAKGLGLATSTELIFGLPGETLATYCATVDKCARVGFDSVNSYNLIMFDGIEMDRPSYRKAHDLDTLWRPLHGSATMFDDGPVVEREEVVVAAKGFHFEDFIAVRKLNVMLKAVYALKLEPDFFAELIARGHSTSKFLLDFVCHGESQRHLDFNRRLHEVVHDNLFSDEMWGWRQEMVRNGEIGLFEDTNAFMPPAEYAGGWFRPALEWVLAQWEEANVEARASDGREGASEAFHELG